MNICLIEDEMWFLEFENLQNTQNEVVKFNESLQQKNWEQICSENSQMVYNVQL